MHISPRCLLIFLFFHCFCICPILIWSVYVNHPPCVWSFFLELFSMSPTHDNVPKQTTIGTNAPMQYCDLIFIHFQLLFCFVLNVSMLLFYNMRSFYLIGGGTFIHKQSATSIAVSINSEYSKRVIVVDVCFCNNHFMIPCKYSFQSMIKGKSPI